MSLLSWVRPHSRLDLHLHRQGSDGRLAPEALLEACAEAGLDCIALTDHDLAPLLPAGRNSVGKRIVHVIHGVELSGSHDQQEFHLLVYFPSEMPQGFKDFCTQRARSRFDRYERARKMLGFNEIPQADSTARNGQRSLTRLHLANAMVESGVVNSRSEAFAKYLGNNPNLFPPVQLSFVEAIREARLAGGVCSWAHPTWEQAQNYAETFRDAGLQGLEAIRPGVKKKARKRFVRLADSLGLFLSGGSDWHGWRKDTLGHFFLNGEQAQGFICALQDAQKMNTHSFS